MEKDHPPPFDVPRGEYYVVTEEVLRLLPQEWQEHLQAIIDDGRVVLRSVDKELSQLIKISNSFTALVSLKYAHRRLSEYKFAAEIDAILEIDMLTTAFVVTYARLQDGKGAAGFSRDDLPEPLRPVHDQILDFRNKRFAHREEHYSVGNLTEINVQDGRFEIALRLALGYYVGGATEWGEVVQFLDNMAVERLDKVLRRLRVKTGREWSLHSDQPSPEESP